MQAHSRLYAGHLACNVQHCNVVTDEPWPGVVNCVDECRMI